MGRKSKAQIQAEINYKANPMTNTEEQQYNVARSGRDKVRGSSGCAKIFWIVVCIAAAIFLAIAFGMG